MARINKYIYIYISSRFIYSKIRNGDSPGSVTARTTWQPPVKNCYLIKEIDIMTLIKLVLLAQLNLKKR